MDECSPISHQSGKLSLVYGNFEFALKFMCYPHFKCFIIFIPDSFDVFTCTLGSVCKGALCM